jgi:replicative DNA helicase
LKNDKQSGLTRRQIEQQVLGALLVNADAINDLVSRLQDKMFAVKEHRVIYGEMVKLYAAHRPVKKMLVAASIGETIGDISTEAFLSALEHGALKEEYLPHIDYADQIADAWKREQTRKLFEKAAEDVYNPQLPVDTTVQTALAAADSIIGEAAEVDAVSIYDAAQKQVEKTAEAHRVRGKAGFDTGLDFIDKLTGPWAAGQLVLVGAPTKVGKTALAMQCAAGLARHGPVLYFSFEMTAELLASREIARRTKISTLRQRTGSVNSEEYAKLIEAANSMDSMRNLHVISQKMSATQIFEFARQFRRRKGLVGIFVDHVGIVKPEKGSRRTDDWEVAGAATPILKEAAEDLGVVAIGLSQVLKESPPHTAKIKERISACLRRPSYQDLKGSIAQDADHIIMPYRPEAILSKIEPSEQSQDRAEWEDAMQKVKDKAEIVLALSRESRWPRSIEVDWDGPATSFKTKHIDQPDMMGYDL